MNEIERLKTQLAVKEEMLKIKDEAFEKLLKENNELHNKIAKAIEYIKETHRPDRGELSVFDEDLLEILKDSDVDE